MSGHAIFAAFGVEGQFSEVLGYLSPQFISLDISCLGDWGGLMSAVILG